MVSRSLSGSFRNALRGVSHSVRTQRNARIHLAAALAVVALAAWLGVPRLEWAVLVLAMGLVVVAEMLNTALEALADAVCPDHRPLVGVAKDVAAGAVLVSAVVAALVGLLVLGVGLLERIG